MANYPHDEFDDIDENSRRRGVYRARNAAGANTRPVMALLGVGVAALLLGGFMYVYSPQTASPDTGLSAKAPASPSQSASASATATGKATTVEIYNSGGVTGAASDAMNLLMSSDAKITITQVGNWQGTPVLTSMVYYSAGHEEIANEVADAIGVDYIQEDPAQEIPIVAVLGPDYVLSSMRVDGPTE